MKTNERANNKCYKKSGWIFLKLERPFIFYFCILRLTPAWSLTDTIFAPRFVGPPFLTWFLTWGLRIGRKHLHVSSYKIPRFTLQKVKPWHVNVMRSQTLQRGKAVRLRCLNIFVIFVHVFPRLPSHLTVCAHCLYVDAEQLRVTWSLFLCSVTGEDGAHGSQFELKILWCKYSLVTTDRWTWTSSPSLSPDFYWWQVVKSNILSFDVHYEQRTVRS